jgi:cell division protein FtsW
MQGKITWDRSLLLAVLALITIGIVMVFSSSALVAQRLGKAPAFFLVRQLIWAVIGLLMMVFCMFVDYRIVKSKMFNYGIIALSLCLLVYVLFGAEGAKRWIRIGSFNIQPSELAKVGVVLFIAYTAQNKEIPISIKKMGGAILVISIIVGLILIEPDLGTAFLISLVFVSMMFVLGINKKIIISLLLIGAILLFLSLKLYNYRMERIIAWWCQIVGKEPPNKEVSDALFQLEQAKIAVGSGGINGVGIGNSLQKLFYIPQPHNDFIFSIIAEELGFIGSVALWFLFFVIFIRGALISKKLDDKYGSYLALGITLMLVYQALINISVVLGMLPTKGIPLPFISYGGSSLITSMIFVGLLLNLSQNLEKS